MENKSSSSRLSFFNILTIIFVVAKILGFINWSWWLVFTPTFLCIGIYILVFIFVVIYAVLENKE